MQQNISAMLILGHKKDGLFIGHLIQPDTRILLCLQGTYVLTTGLPTYWGASSDGDIVLLQVVSSHG